MPDMVSVVTSEDMPVWYATTVTAPMTIRTQIHCRTEFATLFDAPAFSDIVVMSLVRRVPITRNPTSVPTTSTATNQTGAGLGPDTIAVMVVVLFAVVTCRSSANGMGDTSLGGLSVVQEKRFRLASGHREIGAH